MKFAHIEMEREDNPIKWDSLTQDDFNVVMRAKNVFEQCKAYCASKYKQNKLLRFEQKLSK